MAAPARISARAGRHQIDPAEDGVFADPIPIPPARRRSDCGEVSGIRYQRPMAERAQSKYCPTANRRIRIREANDLR